MNVKLFVAIGAAIAVLYGIAFLLIPGFAAAFYGDATPNAPTILAVRFYGVSDALAGIGWLVRQRNVRLDRVAWSPAGPFHRQYSWGGGLHLGNCHGDHERDGLVGSVDIPRAAGGICVLPGRWSR